MRFSLSKRLRKVVLLSASALMCLSLAGGISASASSAKPKQQASLRDRYELYENLYGTPTSYSTFKKIYNNYQKMTPKQQKAERKLLLGKSDRYYKAKTAKQKAEYRKLAGRAVHKMNHSHGLLDYFKNICGVLDSPYVNSHQADNAFRRYQKTYPKILRSSQLRRRYNESELDMHHSSKQGNAHAYRNETLKAINYDREAHHLEPVHYSRKMTEVANMRAKQLTHRYSHYDKRGKLYMNDDMKHLHMGKWDASENIDVKSAPSLNIEPAGQIYIPLNGHEMADESEDQMVYHDNFNDRRPGSVKPGVEVRVDNGHRDNILDPCATTVGVAVGYNKKTHSFYIAEDFHTGNKKRAKYHGKVHYHNYLKDKDFRR